jgi:glycine hydroxymethyltransferase
MSTDRIPHVCPRPGASDAANRFHAELAATLQSQPLAALAARLYDWVDSAERLVDHDCINLYAGTNTMNPRAKALLASAIGVRPSLGHPGEKYNKGVHEIERIEVLAIELLKRLFNAPYAEYRVPSGSIANLYAFMATCKAGDTIVAFDDAAGGHPTHHAIGAAGLYGLKVLAMPFDSARMDVDVDGLRQLARDAKPKLIIVAGSMCLFPYDVRAVREIADEAGAWVLYDAAHMGGLIAGGAFQQPLAEGAHLMTGSTYKSFGGPPSGMVLTTEAQLAERLDHIAYPGLTANFDAAKTAALALATMDLLEHGRAYAQQMIANAQALAEALAAQGVAVFKPAARDQFTVSQHVALDARPYGGGNRASAHIERANILFTSIGLPLPAVTDDANGIRIGTQEVTRWGMREEVMREVARLVARVLVRGEAPERVCADAVALRARYQRLHFIRG